MQKYAGITLTGNNPPRAFDLSIAQGGAFV